MRTALGTRTALGAGSIIAAGILTLLALAGAVGAPVRAAEAPWAPTLGVKPMGQKSVSAFHDGTAYFFQQNQLGEGLQGFSSHDYGLTWTVLPPLPVNGITRVEFVTPDTGLAMTLGGGARLFRTTDGGQTWRQVDRPWKGSATGQLIDAGTDGRTIAIAATVWRDGKGRLWGTKGADYCHDSTKDRLQVFVSSNKGRTWRSQSVVRGHPVSATALDFLDANTGVLVTSAKIELTRTGTCQFDSKTDTGQQVFVTRNDSFEKVLNAPDDSAYRAASAPARKHIVVGGFGGEVTVSFDGGRSFKESTLDGIVEVPTAREHYRWIEDMDFEGRVGYITSNGRGLWRTTDGGRSWAREPSPLDVPGNQGPEYGKIDVADPDRAVAVGPTFVVTRIP